MARDPKYIGRFIGVVNTYFHNTNDGPSAGYGFIYPLLRYTRDGKAARPIHAKFANAQVFVDINHVRSTGQLKKLCTGQVIEYDAYHQRVFDEQQNMYIVKLFAMDVTGVQGCNLPCDFGVVAFKRYKDIDREHNRKMQVFGDAQSEDDIYGQALRAEGDAIINTWS